MSNKRDAMYWRYKKKTPPVDDPRNGAVRIIKPADKLIAKQHKTKKWKPQMTEDLAKKYADIHITNKQLRWLQDERPN